MAVVSRTHPHFLFGCCPSSDITKSEVNASEVNNSGVLEVDMGKFARGAFLLGACDPGEESIGGATPNLLLRESELPIKEPLLSRYGMEMVSCTPPPRFCFDERPSSNITKSGVN